jgi:ubiquinone/menaquinone biosynthesis C-methylase UbiE
MNQEKFPVQVDKSHYFSKYDNVYRFISYYQQIESIIQTKPETILEIGVGNKTVSNYLKQSGYSITTCDFDRELLPDIVGDVRELPFENNSFDTIAACEILEHLPFSDFEKTLEELKRVSKKHVVLSFPYSCAYFEGSIRLTVPFFQKQFHFSIRFPYFFLKIEINEGNKEHYWEIGRKGYSKKVVRNILEKHFTILNEFHPILNSYHYFFILRK